MLKSEQYKISAVSDSQVYGQKRRGPSCCCLPMDAAVSLTVFFCKFLTHIPSSRRKRAEISAADYKTKAQYAKKACEASEKYRDKSVASYCYIHLV
jgi:hypothetical protein